MPVAIAEPIDAEGVALTDIIIAEQYYSPETLEKRLGIDARVVREAVKRHGGSIFSSHREGDPDDLYGRHVLAWLRIDRVAYEVTECEIALQKRLRSSAAVKRNHEPATLSGVERALALADEGRASEAEDRAVNEHNGYSTYVRLLRRPEGELSDPEIQELSFIIRDLGLDNEQIERDGALVRRVQTFTVRHASLEQANRDVIASRNAVAEYEREATRKLKELQREHSSASSRAFQAHGASDELARMRRSRPGLFSADSEPAELLGGLPLASDLS